MREGWAYAGSEICSDFLPITIPAGAEIWIRVGTYSASPWPRQMSPQNPLTASGATFGRTRVSDGMVASCSRETRTRNYGMWPIGIISRTTHGAVLGIGDSICQGSGDEHDESDSFGLIGRAVSDTHAYINAGVGGDTLGRILASYDKRLSLARWVKNIIFEHGVNGVGNTDLATTKTQMIALWMLGAQYKRRDARLFQTTITPSTKSSDSFATVENQTLTAGFESGRREILNDWLRDGAPMLDGAPVATGLSGASRAGDGSHPLHAVFDVAGAVESSRNSGKWKVNGTPNWLTSDGLHPNRNGYLLVKASGAIDVTRFA